MSLKAALKINRNTIEKQWDAYYHGCSDKRNHKAYYNIYLNKDEALMYELGWNDTRKKIKNKRRKPQLAANFHKVKHLEAASNSATNLKCKHEFRDTNFCVICGWIPK